MPKIKIDHVVSFSSEDPVHVANNILSEDPSKKWKCKNPGEKSASIVLQLEKASVITGVDIGNEHSAYIEVHVARSTSTDDYKVLLVMSSFMTPLESRQSQNVNKVRMFTQNDFSKPECEQKWDRVKIICTQPFNRHVQYGLSFVTFHSNDSVPQNNQVRAVVGKFPVRPDSPDNLSAGSLFARRKELENDTAKEVLKGAAAIREASSSGSSPVCKPKLKLSDVSSSSTATPKNLSKEGDDSAPRSRNRKELLYAKDEEERKEKIDRIIEKKAKEKAEQQTYTPNKKENNNTPSQSKKKDTSDKNNTNSEEPKQLKEKELSDSSSKRKHSQDRQSKTVKKQSTRQTKPFSRLLEGVTFVISGIQNPDRANLRTMALAMGAKYKTDWDNSCTHLICAFVNTPKFNQVKGKGKIVTKKWIEDCYNHRKRLPWRRYALDRNDKGEESEEEIWEETDSSTSAVSKNNYSDSDVDTREEHSDTEDRIERIRARLQDQPSQKKPEDQNTLSNKTDDIFEASTDEEPDNNDLDTETVNNISTKLKRFFDKKLFYVDHNLNQELFKQINQYITAYKGVITDDPTENIDVFITTKDNAETLKDINPSAVCVTPDWVWDCHNSQKLVPMDDFTL